MEELKEKFLGYETYVGKINLLVHDALVNAAGADLIYYDPPKSHIAMGIVQFKRAAKYVVRCTSDDAAEYIINVLQAALSERPDLYIQSHGRTEKHPYEPHIKVIHAKGQIVLSTTEAHMNGHAVVSNLKKNYCESLLLNCHNSDDKDLLMDLIDGYSQHKLLDGIKSKFCSEYPGQSDAINFLEKLYLNGYPDDYMIMYRRSSGESYRLSYFDSTYNERKQVSLGDIVIVVGDHIDISQPLSRKQRTDIFKPKGKVIQRVKQTLYYEG